MRHVFALTDQVELIVANLSADPSVNEIWLIGSRPSGTAKSGSDWDLLVRSNKEAAVVPTRTQRVDVLWSGPSGKTLLEGQADSQAFPFEDFRWRETHDGEAEYRGRKFTDLQDGIARDTSEPAQVFITCRAVRLWRRGDVAGSYQTLQIISDDPYENQLIGRFIAELCYRAGKANKPCPSVDLYQQTPTDKTFGDLLIQTGSFFLIEFKRYYLSSLKKEVKKWKRESLLAFLDAQQEWTSPPDTTGWDFSSSAHFLVSGQKNDPDKVVVQSYMRAVLAGGTRQRPLESVEDESLTVFANRLLAPKVLIPAAQMYAYLSALVQYEKEDDGSGQRKRTSLVAAILEDGRVAVITREAFRFFCRLCVRANKSLPNVVPRQQPVKTGPKIR